MTVCPIAIVATCRKCPVFAVCPLKGMLGDHVKDVPAAAKPKRSGRKPPAPAG
jgi:hypothetical protein